MADLTQLTPTEDLYRDLEPGRLHDNTAWVVLTSRGQVRNGLGILEGGTFNHRTGWTWLALAQVAEAAEGRGLPDHLYRMDAVIEHALEALRLERERGHLRWEFGSSTYWQRHVALHRLGQWRETLRLLKIYPDHQGLRLLAGELIVWERQDRTLLRAFRAGDGVIQPVGVRMKGDPHEEEAGSLKSHYWHRHVTHSGVRDQIRRTEDAARNGGSRLRHRPHEALQVRLLLSPEGQLLESLSREPAPVRVAHPVGVFRLGDGSLHVLMPGVELIHESPGLSPTQVVWEVACSPNGRVILRVAANHLGVPGPTQPDEPPEIGRVWPHPEGLQIPDGWRVFGPDTPVVEAPPWEGGVGDGGRPSPPPEEEEPMPEDPGHVPLPKIARDPDFRELQDRLGASRDGSPVRTTRQWAHRTLVKLNRLGAWDYKETP